MASAQSPGHDRALPDGEAAHSGQAVQLRLGEVLAERLPAWLDAGSGQPAITFFDVFDGQRTELSLSTLKNWTAKLANLLQFELPEQGVAGGDVALRTAGHWAAVPAALAAWRLGRSVVAGPAGSGRAAALTVAYEDDAGPDDLVVGAALGGYLSAPDSGLRSFTTEVLAEPDDLDADPPDPQAVALVRRRASAPDADDAPPAELTLSDAATGLGALEGTWALLAPVDEAAGLVAVAAAVLTDVHLVIAQTSTEPDPDLLQRIIETERVSAVLTHRLREPADQLKLTVPVVALPDW